MKKLFPSVVLLALVCSSRGVIARPPTVDPTYSTTALDLKPAAKPIPAPISNWIWGHAGDIGTVFARGTVSLAQVPKEAFLYATGDDSCDIYVNGHKVESTSAVEKGWANVHPLPVANLLTTGINVMGLRGVNQGGAAGLLAQLVVDGREVLTTDDHWLVSSQAAVPDDWNAVRFNPAGWTPAKIIAPYGGGPWADAVQNWPGGGSDAAYLKHLVIPPRSGEAAAGADQITGLGSFGPDGKTNISITPVAGTEPVLLIDFGQEYAGRLQLWGTAGAAVTITTGEAREECVHQEPALDNSGPFQMTLAGSAPTSTPYSAFRFARVVFHGTAPVEISRVIFDYKYYPVQYRGSFDCSDPVLTKVWYTGAYTAHLCMQENIWDAPKRDRGLWIGDLQVSGQTINDAFADKFLMEQSIEQVREIAQHGKPDTELPVEDVNTLPGYSAAWFCTLADFYRHSGDKDYLSRQHDRIVSLLEYQKTEFNDQDVYQNGSKWDFTDWAPGFVTDSPLARAATHLYIIYGVHEAVYLLRELGDTAQADKYAAWADELTAAARTQFLAPGAHTFGDRLQENVMAVLSGVATSDEQAEIARQFLRQDSPVWKAHLTGNIDESEVMSPYYGYFVLEAMTKLDQPQDALDLIRRYWGDMLRRGAVTWWEKFDPSWSDNFKDQLDKMPYLSLSHGWSTGPTSYLSETVLGVRPTSAGYQTVDIKPRLGDLTWAEGDVPAPGGAIHVRVDQQELGSKVVVKLPANVSATIELKGKKLTASRPGTYTLTAP